MTEEQENNDKETPEDKLVDQLDSGGNENSEEEVTPLSVAEAEINDLRDKLLRAVAETENVRRRSEKEKADAANYSMTNFARDMLAIGDNLHRALESLPENEELSDSVKTLIEGVKMTDRELHNIFVRHGIDKIDPKVRTACCVRQWSAFQKAALKNLTKVLTQKLKKKDGHGTILFFAFPLNLVWLFRQYVKLFFNRNTAFKFKRQVDLISWAIFIVGFKKHDMIAARL